jgi:lysophospholipase L1-like esterase
LLKLVRDRYEQLRLVKLGCGGETTTTMVVGTPWCGPKITPGSQLAQATTFLRANRDDVAFVTIDIGGNDVTHPDGGGVAAIQANLPVILRELREAAGPGVPIVGMTYYHPFLPDVWFATHDAVAVKAAVDAIHGFNQLLASIYSAAGDPVADVETAFATSDVADADSDGVPDNVERACAWTWRCAPPPHGPDIHPNTAGYGAIARAFESVLTS